MVIIAREFAVTGLRQLAMEHGEVIPASGWGKIKTALQIAMVLALIIVDSSPAWVDALVYVTVVVTVASARRLLLQLPDADSRAAVEPLARRDVTLGVLA